MLTLSTVNLWILGYPERAAQKIDQTFVMAKRLSHPLNLVTIKIRSAGFYQYQHEASRTLRLSDEGIEMATKYGFTSWLASGKMLKGWALAKLGQPEEGISLLNKGFEDWCAIGPKTGIERFIYLLAAAYLLADRGKEGLNRVDEALSLVEETEVRFYQSELIRLRGELIMKSAPRPGKRAVLSQAESCFHHAIDTARRQQAKSFELRATVSLCRLWQKTGKAKEAKAMLAKIYSWFTDGFDSPDLKAAKDLLDRLA